MSAFDYTDHHMDWEGIALLVKWCPSWNGENAIYQIAHLEIHAANKTPLPITETGYKSHFIDKEAVEVRISEIPDSDYANSRTAVSVISGQLGHD